MRRDAQAQAREAHHATGLDDGIAHRLRVSSLRHALGKKGEIVNDIPEGFNAEYPCRNHPERKCVAPIALRMCEECLKRAHANYAAQTHMDYSFRFQDEKAPDGRGIYGEMRGDYKRTQEQGNFS